MGLLNLLGSLTGPWLWSPLVYYLTRQRPQHLLGQWILHPEGTAPTPNLRNSAWCLAQCFSNVATSQNHLEALKQTRAGVQPAGQWVASPSLSQSCPGVLPPGESCLQQFHARKECSDGDAAGGLQGTRLDSAWKRAKGHGSRSTVSSSLSCGPTPQGGQRGAPLATVASLVPHSCPAWRGGRRPRAPLGSVFCLLTLTCVSLAGCKAQRQGLSSSAAVLLGDSVGSGLQRKNEDGGLSWSRDLGESSKA